MNISFLFLRRFILILIGINIFLSAWYILHGDIFFHTDIARDFLVLGDIVKTHHLTLIGPRAGGITGVFHGPLWFYINLPVFIVSHGNPVAVGWFWVGLSITSVIVTYFVAKKMFDEMTALLSALLVSIVTITSTSNMFNPFGAVIVFPIYYYLFNEYLKTHKIQTLLIALFTLGIIIQFQMAFGIPLLLLSLLYLGKDLYKQKKLSHLFSVFILIIPLSTFILFDIKHSFMQIRSVFFYMTHETEEHFNFLVNIFLRIKGLLFQGPGIITLHEWLNVFPALLLGLLLWLFRKKKDHQKQIFTFFYFYISFWIVTLGFRGTVEVYYYLPFLCVIAMMISISRKYITTKIFIPLIMIIIMANYYFALKHVSNATRFIGHDASSWRFNLKVAQDIERDAPQEFGYYIYTPDQYGYIPRYAMDYIQNGSKKKIYAYEKKEVTYAIIQPAPNYRPELNGRWWLSDQVKITKKPIAVKTYSNNEKVLKFNLTSKEIAVPSDPNIINGLQFR